MTKFHQNKHVTVMKTKPSVQMHYLSVQSLDLKQTCKNIILKNYCIRILIQAHAFFYFNFFGRNQSTDCSDGQSLRSIRMWTWQHKHASIWLFWCSEILTDVINRFKSSWYAFICTDIIIYYRRLTVKFSNTFGRIKNG